MKKILINEVERDLAEVDAGWINQQIINRQQDGVPICVRVTIKADGLDMVLSSNGCPSGTGGGGRAPVAAESRLFDLWDKFDLKDSPINNGKLVAFLKQAGCL